MAVDDVLIRAPEVYVRNSVLRDFIRKIKMAGAAGGEVLFDEEANNLQRLKEVSMHLYQGLFLPRLMLLHNVQSVAPYQTWVASRNQERALELERIREDRRAA